MFVSFLFPYPARNTPATHLWVFYKQLGVIPLDDVHFIGSRTYFMPPDQMKRPWEFDPNVQRKLGFQIPEADFVSAVPRSYIEEEIFQPLLDREQTHNGVFRSLITAEFKPLTERIAEILHALGSKEGTKLEAIVSWINCPSLNAAAAQFELPVIHHELGPLRPPDFLPTAYFDLSGVNGNTSAETLYHKAASELPSGEGAREQSALWQRLLRVATLDAEVTQDALVGIPLQVEDDSNILAYSHSTTNHDLLSHAVQTFGQDRVLARRHPSGWLDYPASLWRLDDSKTAAQFIARCEQIWTINSSVGLEALIAGKTVRCFGDTSYAFITAPGLSSEERSRRLLHFLSAYLIPYRLIFNLEYYRWRLSGPCWSELAERHRNHFEAEARQSSIGPQIFEISLLERLPEARLTIGKPGQMNIWDVNINAASSRAIFMQPPAQLVFDLPTSAAGRFSTAVAMHPDVWQNPQSGGCEFQVSINDRIAAVVAIDPVQHEDERRWHEIVVDVQETPFGKHVIAMQTKQIGATNFRWALWREPRFCELPNFVSTTVS